YVVWNKCRCEGLGSTQNSPAVSKNTQCFHVGQGSQHD
ncbi:hypothetical protein V3C99_017143, partial [Haemonchus contortus]